MKTVGASQADSYAIGVDVGGTKIAAGIVDSHGRIMTRRLIPTLPKRGGEAVLADALAVARELCDEACRQAWHLAGVGVGLCELVDVHGLVASSHTIHWRGLPVRERFAALLPATLDADSRAAAFCEARCGAGRDRNSFFYVTVGTGIGSSLVLDGKPFLGSNGCTGEIASAPLRVVHPETGELTSAVLENVASGAALVARYNRRTGAALVRAEEVLHAAAAGDATAIDIVETAAVSLASTIALLVNVLAPEAVIVGGGLGTAPGLFWERLQPAIRAHIWSDTLREVPILQAAHGADAGLIGAALLALERYQPHEPR
jgi:predicted NBD/HSP70 family sugar kinase